MALTRHQSETSEPGAVCPRTPEDIFAPKMGPVSRALRLTLWGMRWEAAARAFWVLAALLGFVFAALALGIVAAVPDAVLPWLAGAVLLALVVAAVRGGLRYRPALADAAMERVDRTLPGRPLTALVDQAAIGGEGALWQAHLAQMRARAGAARPVAPDAELSRRDPFALRLVALVALVMALIFGGAGQMGQGVSAIAATFNRMPEMMTERPAGPGWEGWAEPPAYTGRPTIYMNALPEGQVLELPKGSTVSFRLYGSGSEVVQDIGPSEGGDADAPGFRAEQSGTIEIAGRRFDVTVLPDAPPVIRAGAAPVRRADGRMVQEFEATDDHGVLSGHAMIALNLEAVDRRHGLATDPEPREPVELALPMPRGDRRELRGQLVEDLARHPWANLPVTVSLHALDGIEQAGQSQPMQVILPGRRFFDPLAASLIEMRRDLLWSRGNAGRSAEILRALTWQPDGFVDDALYRELRGAVSVLEQDGPLSDDARDRLAEALWQAAVMLEDGGLSDALERMRQAQQRLSEAIRQGANPDEIQRLMDELKEATDAYTDMLAEQGEQDPSERFTRNQQGQQITGDQIQQMMDEIQRLMNEGRMAEAQQLLEQFNRMMENLQVRQGEGEGGESGPGGQSMNRLADTLREQQRLSDEAFRELQEQFGRGQPESGEGGEDGEEGDLAGRQRDLREELGQQRGLLPGQGSEGGDEAGRRLDEAGRAMEEAEEALRRGDMGGALQRQADAIQSMREGMRALGDMLSEDQRRQADDGQQQGDGQQGQEQSEQQGEGRRAGRDGMPYNGRPVLDPLGREQGGNGNVIGGGDPLAEGADPAQRARDLLDEIRRRTAERDRPADERGYLDRLLERF
ncbi:TIGR02302 family protein [Paracoccus alcaliphilus]|uniref:TIGR02302 family protein n=1 Tax=Paracoccus alcaliphilus TaxID=34002 RepID=A0A1H8FDV3_9RHOB|nr:DUF4175 family protein [Paracoccus alcaliphilus]SEN29842.1 TIGR02302 family protein [Paracoccus alcaliphilus]